MKHTTIAIFIATNLLFACDNERKEGRADSSDSTSSTKVKNETPVATDTAGVKFPAPGEFHRMLARSNGVWMGEGTLQFSPDAAPINGGRAILTNTMAMDGLYQVSEIKGNITPGMGVPWTGIRITGYDSERKLFTRAMIGDGASAGGVSMEGQWDEATQSITMPFKKVDAATGTVRNLIEVYKIIDEKTEVLEIHATDPKTKKKFKVLNVKWTRKK